jgi:hypothetical protein
MDFKYHLETAWSLTLKHIASLLFLTLTAVAVSVVSLGILAPVVMAGYMQSILRLVRDGREPEVQDVFSQMGLFLPLFVFGILLTVAVLVGFLLLFLPGVLIMVGVSYCCIYMLPLMTDRSMGLVDAAKESFSMVTKEKIGDHVIVFLLFAGISSIGSTVLLGSLFTHPLATVFLMSIYHSLAGEQKAVEPTGAEETSIP